MTPANVQRILLVGVGGQGVLTAARSLGHAASRDHKPVVVGQEHGMSQRQGSVSNTVVIGDRETSFVTKGEADVLLAFEPLEGLRAKPRLGPGVQILLNTRRIVPFSATLLGAAYPSPDEIVRALQELSGAKVWSADATQLAASLGSPRALGAAMLGLAWSIGLLNLSKASVLQALSGPGRPDARTSAQDVFLRAAESALGHE